MHHGGSTLSFLQQIDPNKEMSSVKNNNYSECKYAIVLQSLIIPSIPLSKSSQALSQAGIGLETKVLLQWGCVCVGHGHVARLHGHEFLVGIEVVILRKHSCTYKLFLQDGYEVKEIFGRVVADVVYLVRGDGQSVLAVPLLRGVLHDAHHSLHDVVDIGEVALAVAIVENLDGFAFHQLIGEAKVSHVGTAGGAIDGKEAEAGRGDVVEFRVGMGHQLIALLRGGVEAHGVVHLVVCRIRHLLVAAIDGRGRGIDQMLHLVVATGLEDVVESDEVALDIGVGVGDAVAHACLGGEVDDYGYMVVHEDVLHGCLVGDGGMDEGPVALQRLYLLQAFILDVDIVVISN
jgi:hypothetical protein